MSVEQHYAGSMNVQDWGNGCCREQWDGAAKAVELSPAQDSRLEQLPPYHLPCAD
jgi:hypothetical protein